MFCDSYRIQTYNLLIRSQMLYSVELRSHAKCRNIFFLEICDSYRIQTYNLLIRSQMLYSVELRSRYFWFASAKVWSFSETTKHFASFFEKKLHFSLFNCVSVGSTLQYGENIWVLNSKKGCWRKHWKSALLKWTFVAEKHYRLKKFDFYVHNM